MQWPPTRPGLKDLKPYGLVAAASITSQTSSPMRSHNCVTWLTSAMLTFRKTFSRSLVISALAGDDTGTTRRVSLRNSNMARRVLSASHPPTTVGMWLDGRGEVVGTTLSGRTVNE